MNIEDNKKTKEKILIIGGPTCVGKSDYAVKIAQKYNGEIISADSVQMFRGLDIGSGKITKEEMKGIPHHMIDILEPFESATVVDFKNKAKALITDIISRGKLPIVVGGTGFYINALINGYDCGNAAPSQEKREHIKLILERKGSEYLNMLLKKLDPEIKISSNDIPRMERKIECLFDEKVDSTYEPQSEEMYDGLFIVMDANREILCDMAAKRISKMMEMGLMKEVKKLYVYRNFPCMNTVGYKQCVIGYECNMPQEEIEEYMLQAYRGLIKKQQTFFRWVKWEKKIVAYDWDMKEANKAIKEYYS